MWASANSKHTRSNHTQSNTMMMLRTRYFAIRHADITANKLRRTPRRGMTCAHVVREHVRTQASIEHTRLNHNSRIPDDAENALASQSVMRTSRQTNCAESRDEATFVKRFFNSTFRLRLSSIILLHDGQAAGLERANTVRIKIV